MDSAQISCSIASPHNHLPGGEERRRTVRIKRSGLRKYELDDMDRPALKFAETTEEFSQAFSLVYDVYLKKKFICEPKPHQMLYTVYSLLPQTTHIIAKSYLTVISNLTEIFDTPEFGLPMDIIFKPELDELRSQGRRIVELGSLATPTDHRWKNIFLYLVQMMYWYSVYSKVDDVCIAINPRHVRFYKHLFPFEQLGTKQHYPRVDAPAICLRGRVQESMQRMFETCRGLEFETPLYRYFYRMTAEEPNGNTPYLDQGIFDTLPKPAEIDAGVIQPFVDRDPGLVQNLSAAQKEALLAWYPELLLKPRK